MKLVHEREEVEADESSADVGVFFDVFVVIEKFGSVDSPASRVHEYSEDRELEGEEKEGREKIEENEENEGVSKPKRFLIAVTKLFIPNLRLLEVWYYHWRIHLQYRRDHCKN